MLLLKNFAVQDLWFLRALIAYPETLIIKYNIGLSRDSEQTIIVS